MALSGSIRRATINGITYNVAADANAAKTPETMTEGVRHSGGVLQKITLEVGQVESLTLILTDSEYNTLLALTNPIQTPGDVPLSYTKADGSSWVSQGRIHLDNYESEENRCDVTMIPSSGTWDLFAA